MVIEFQHAIYRSTEVFGELEALFFAKTNSWNIRLFPKPVGSTPKTSFPLRSDFTSSFCSTFKTNPKSLAKSLHPSQHRSSSHEAFQWNWYISIFLMRCDWHLMTDCVRIRPMGISRCWKNGLFWTNLIYAFSAFSIFQFPISTLFAPQVLHKLLLWNALGNMQTSQEHFTTIVYAKFGGQTEWIMGN